MSQKAKKNESKEVSIIELTRKFPDDSTAEKWFESIRWKNGIYCPFCGSLSITKNMGKAQSNPYRCKGCRKFFSVKIGTIMQGSRLGYQAWVFGIYMFSTSIKGISSMKLHRDLGITQKSAWLMSHKLRSIFDNEPSKL